MRCCAFCGMVAMGGSTGSGVGLTHKVKLPDMALPPYGAANIFMLPFCSFIKDPPSDTVAPSVEYWQCVCTSCANQPRTAFVLYHTMEMARTVVLSDPLHVQRLSLVVALRCWLAPPPCRRLLLPLPSS